MTKQTIQGVVLSVMCFFSGLVIYPVAFILGGVLTFDTYFVYSEFLFFNYNLVDMMFVGKDFLNFYFRLFAFTVANLRWFQSITKYKAIFQYIHVLLIATRDFRCNHCLTVIIAGIGAVRTASSVYTGIQAIVILVWAFYTSLHTCCNSVLLSFSCFS